MKATTTSSTKLSLICIPYAGGSKYSFKDLKSYLQEGINFETLELPGRGKRVVEPLLVDLDEMVEDLFGQIQPFLNDQYVLYGHSMGGMLGNLLIQKLKANGLPLPISFLVTGCSSPLLKSPKSLHKLGHEDFMKELKLLGGLPDEILTNNDLMEFFIPILRADMQGLETYNFAEQEGYNVPIVAIAGTTEDITDKQLLGWATETNASFEAFRYSGNHFFILNHYEKLAEIIHENLLTTESLT